MQHFMLYHLSRSITRTQWATEVCLQIDIATGVCLQTDVATGHTQGDKGDNFIRQLSMKLNLNQYLKWREVVSKLAQNCHHLVSSPILVLSILHETLIGHHISLVEVKGAWTVPLKSMVVFSPSSVSACISLPSLINAFLMELVMSVLIKQNFTKFCHLHNLDLTECQNTSQSY